MRQIQIQIRKGTGTRPQPIDTRTPSGRVLPY
jgi:hypothetical protein